MAESFIPLTGGSGYKAHTFNRTIGANSVEDDVIINGEHYLASYHGGNTAAISFATAASHLFQIMAGASLKVYVRRIRVYQMVGATAAAFAQVQVLRLTTAGTGGTALTPNPRETTDSASGHTFMTLPTAKGTEGVEVDSGTFEAIQTVPVAGGGYRGTLIFEGIYDDLRSKSLVIPAGTTNGIALKLVTALAAATGFVVADTVEANF